jgi:hypothetical protein
MTPKQHQCSTSALVLQSTTRSVLSISPDELASWEMDVSGGMRECATHDRSSVLVVVVKQLEAAGVLEFATAAWALPLRSIAQMNGVCRPLYNSTAPILLLPSGTFDLAHAREAQRRCEGSCQAEGSLQTQPTRDGKGIPGLSLEALSLLGRRSSYVQLRRHLRFKACPKSVWTGSLE